MVVLLVGLVPIGSSAAEDDGIDDINLVSEISGSVKRINYFDHYNDYNVNLHQSEFNKLIDGNLATGINLAPNEELKVVFDSFKKFTGFRYEYMTPITEYGGYRVTLYDNNNNIIHTTKTSASERIAGKNYSFSSNIIYKNVKSVGIKLVEGSNLVLTELFLYQDVNVKNLEVIGLDYIVEGNNITLTWTNPESADFEGVNIYRDGALVDTTMGESFSETLSSHTGPGYNATGTYQYRLTTIEDGNESKGVTIDVSIQYPPTTVKNLRIINRTSTGGTVTWTKNPVYENIEKYIVSVNGEKHGEIEAPPYVLEGLEEWRVYTISVQAINNYGISEPSTLTYIPKNPELQNTITIDVGDVFSNVNTLFANMRPLLALVLAIILSPKIYHLIKSNVT